MDTGWRSLTINQGVVCVCKTGECWAPTWPSVMTRKGKAHAPQADLRWPIYVGAILMTERVRFLAGDG